MRISSHDTASLPAQSGSLVLLKKIGLVISLTALLEIAKTVLAPIPNVEVVTLLLIVFARTFGKQVLYLLPAFLLVEAQSYGWGLWIFMYAYVWTIPVLLGLLFRQRQSVLFWGLVSGLFGVAFGGLCTLPYLFTAGASVAKSWWIAGLSFDLIHGAANFAIAMLLLKPCMRFFQFVKEKTASKPEAPSHD